MPVLQGRYWLLTIDVAKLAVIPQPHDKLVWIIGQREIGGRTGYEHWQVVCSFNEKVSMRVVKSYFCNEAHCELTKGEAANRYVFKDDTKVPGSEFEYGRRPFKRNSKTDWDAIWESAVAGRINDIPADVRIRNYTTLRRIAVDNCVPERRDDITVKCFYGGTGLGKTRRAWFEAGDDVYVKDPCTKWWDGYKGQKRVIIDEFTGLINIAHMLRWFDRYPCMAEIKGFSVPLKATEFWITSNLNPRDWYKDITEDQKQALLRRMEVTQFVFEWQPPREDLSDLESFLSLI